MSRIYTLLAIVILIPVLLFGALFFLLSNPEYYRDQLERTFEDQTGFELDIKGDIRWRYWPPIALSISDVKVRPPGSATPLASLNNATVDLQLLALITGGKKLAVDGISVDGVRVNALVDKSGKANWVSPKAQPAPPAAAAPPASPTSEKPASAGAGSSIDLEVRKMEITNSTLDYKDESAGANYTIAIPSVTMGALRYDVATPVTFSVHVVDNTGGLKTDLDGKGDVTVSRGFSKIAFSRMDLKQKVQMAGLKDIAMDLRLEGNYDVDASKLQTNLDGKINSSSVKGTFGAALADKTTATFDLNIDQLKAADFLPDTTAATGTTKTTVPPADVDVLPLDTLNSFVLHGKLAVGSLTYDTFNFNDANIALEDQDKRLTVNADVKGYDGKADLNFVGSTDGNGAGHTNLSVDGINITKLTGFESITGTVQLSSNTTFTGHMLSDVMNSLDGTTTFHVTNGTLDVTSVKKLAATVDSLRGKQSSIATWPDKMPFKFLDGEHRFVNGTAAGQQLNFAVENLTVKGTGGLDYFKNHLAYDLGVSLKPSDTSPLKVSDTLANVEWPLHCEGALDASPADLCKPDKDGIQKALGQMVKNKAEESVKQKIEEKLPQLKDKVKSLFGH